MTSNTSNDSNLPSVNGSPELHPASGLVEAVEKIVARSLSKDEVIHWQKIQETYGIADDDPLVMVLILLGVHQHLLNALPEKIAVATDRAIMIHRTTLEDQATIVAKGLLEKLAPMFVKVASEKAAAAKSAGQRVGSVRVGSLCFAGLLLTGGAAIGVALSHFFIH